MRSDTTVGSALRSRITILLLAVAVCCAVTVEMSPTGSLSLIGTDLGVPTPRIGVAVSSYAVGTAVAAIPLTALLGRFDLKRVVVFLGALFALTAAISGLAPTAGALQITRAINGAVHGGFFATVLAYGASVAPSTQAPRAMATILVGNAVALAAGVPLGNVVSQNASWQWTVFGPAVALAGTIAIVAATGARTSRQRDSDASSWRKVPAVVVALALLFGVALMGHFTLYTYLETLTTSRSDSPAFTPVTLTAYGVGVVAGTAVSGKLTTRFGLSGAAFVVALEALSILSYGVFTGEVPTLLLVMAIGCCFGLLPTIVQSHMLEASSVASRTFASSLAVVAFNLGIAGGGLLGGRALAMSVNMVWTLGALFLLISCLGFAVVATVVRRQ